MRAGSSEVDSRGSGSSSRHGRRSRASQAPGRLSLDKFVHRSGTSRATFGKGAGGTHEPGLLQLPPKVRRFVAHAADGFEHPPRLRHGEALREEAHGDVRPPELAAQAFDGIDDDPLVVEAEWRGPI